MLCSTKGCMHEELGSLHFAMFLVCFTYVQGWLDSSYDNNMWKEYYKHATFIQKSLKCFHFLAWSHFNLFNQVKWMKKWCWSEHIKITKQGITRMHCIIGWWCITRVLNIWMFCYYLEPSTIFGMLHVSVLFDIKRFCMCSMLYNE